MTKTSKPLTDRDLEVLAALPEDTFVRPMDIGGTDASHHSATLQKLARYKLAEQKRFYVGVSGGHWRYQRISITAEALRHTRILAGYSCAGDGDVVCGQCGPCEAVAFLDRWGLL